MRHHLDRNVDAGFEAFQKRLRTRQLATPELDNQNRKLFHLPSVMVQREAFAADRESVRDGWQGGFSYTAPYIGKTR